MAIFLTGSIGVRGQNGNAGNPQVPNCYVGFSFVGDGSYNFNTAEYVISKLIENEEIEVVYTETVPANEPYIDYTPTEPGMYFADAICYDNEGNIIEVKCKGACFMVWGEGFLKLFPQSVEVCSYEACFVYGEYIDKSYIGDDADFDDISVVWEWGDGTETCLDWNPNLPCVLFDTGTPICHTYLNPGNYTITATLTLPNSDDGTDCGSSTATQTITILEPSVDFSYATNCNEVQFTDLSNCAVTWEWKIADVVISTEQNPEWTAPSGGTYLVTLTITDQNGMQYTVTKPIVVSQTPTIEVAGNTNICPGDLAQTYTVTNANLFNVINWQVDGGTITANNGSSIDVLWSSINGGTVTVTATTPEGCAETNTLMVTTNAAYCCTFEQVYQPAYDIPYGNSGTITTWADVSNPWNSNTVYINDDINIYGKLIINMTLRFGPNGRIVVHPGGVLTLQNAQLSGDDRCSTMWHGIRVLGPGINQERIYGDDISGPNNFGHLIVQNNVLISNAVVAVAANDLPKFDMTHIVANINNYIQEDENQSTTLPAVNLNDMYYTPLAISTAGGVVAFNNTGVNTDPSSMTTRIFNCFDGVFLGWYKQKNLYAPNPPNDDEVVTVISEVYINQTADLYYPFDPLSMPAIIGSKSETAVRQLFYSTVSTGGSLFTNLKYGQKTNVCDNIFFDYNIVKECSVGYDAADVLASLADDAHQFYSNSFINNTVGLQARNEHIEIVKSSPLSSNLFQNNINSTSSSIGVYLAGCSYNLKDALFDGNTTSAVLLDNINTYGSTNTNLANKVTNNDFDNTVFGIIATDNNIGTQIFCNRFDNYLGAMVFNENTAGAGNLDDQGNCNEFSPKPANNSFFTPWNQTFPDITAVYTANDFNYFYYPSAEYTPTVNNPAIVVPNPCFLEGANYACLTPEPPGIAPTPEEINNTLQNGTNTERINLAVALLTEFQQDTAQAISLLEQAIADPAAVQLLLPVYLKSKNDTMATALINGLPTTTTAEINYKALAQLLLNKNINNQAWWQLNETETTWAKNLAAINTKAGFAAQALVALNTGCEYYLPPVNTPDTSFSAKRQQPPFAASPAVYFDNTITQCQWQLNHNLGNNQPAEILVYDAMGHLVLHQTVNGKGKTTISAHHLPPAIYFAIVKTGNETAIRQKLLIVR
jgi:hypothetical protein